MQTFLPYRSFQSSARVLDRQRLGKQRVEVLQIMKGHVQTDGLHGGWAAHPAARMWEGSLNWLMNYQSAICAEWLKRGYKDTCLDKTLELFSRATPEQVSDDPPWWLGRKILHASHRANLLRKDPEVYGVYGWKEKPTEGYWWPVLKTGGSGYII
jgi:hypothetical protein